MSKGVSRSVINYSLLAENAQQCCLHAAVTTVSHSRAICSMATYKQPLCKDHNWGTEVPGDADTALPGPALITAAWGTC
jgi:hypothetical protein